MLNKSPILQSFHRLPVLSNADQHFKELPAIRGSKCFTSFFNPYSIFTLSCFLKQVNTNMLVLYSQTQCVDSTFTQLLGMQRTFFCWVTFWVDHLLQPADFLINLGEMKHLVRCVYYQWGKWCCSIPDLGRFKLDCVCEYTTPEQVEGMTSCFPCGCSWQLDHLVMVEIYTV